MPVIFKGRSEYNRNYKWNPSYRSASFMPNLNQSANDAGMRSDQIGSSQEPRITAKKKVRHRDPQVQSCLIWWPGGDAEDRKYIKGDASIKANSRDGSPVIKAYERRERENKTPVRLKDGPKPSGRSFDDGVLLGPRKNDRKERKALQEQTTMSKKSQSKAIQTDKERKLCNTKSVEQTRKKATSPRDEDGNRSILQSAGVKRSSPKTIHENKTVKKQVPSDQRKTPKKPRQTTDNIPLQHKAGLQAGKPQRTSRSRLTEYQRNFIPPKFSAKPSPVLSALEVVHSSSAAIPPHSSRIKFRPTSEYVAEYKATGSPDRSLNFSEKSPASPSMKTKVKDIQKPFFAPAAQKSSKSEYASRYEANTDFQVGELREMAENNKQRHEGTHIDPNHATQVASPFNKCWEASSDGGSVIKETSEVEKKSEDASEELSEEQWSRASQKGSDTITLGEDDKETDVDTDSLEAISVATRDLVVRKLEWDEETENEGESQKDAKSEASHISQSILQGRITTPRLQEIGGALRTHHDLTTPCKGGALLTSPSLHTKSRTTGSYTASKTSEQLTSPVAGTSTQDAQKLLKVRSHPLVRSSPCLIPSGQTPEKHRSSSAKEHSVKKESPSRCQRAQSSSPVVTRHSTSLATVRAPIHGALKNEEFQHCGPTGRAQTVSAFSRRGEDALSVASSLTSARASKLLRRAEERKSFWTTA